MSTNPPPEGPLTARGLHHERHRELFRSIQDFSLNLPVSLGGHVPCPICDTPVKVFPAFNENTSKGWNNLKRHMVQQHSAKFVREEIKQKYGIDLPPTPQRGNGAAKQAAKTGTASSRKLKFNTHHKSRDHRMKQWMSGKEATLAFADKSFKGKWQLVEQHSNKFGSAWEKQHDLRPGSFANFDKVVATVKQLEAMGYRGIVLSYPTLFPSNNGSAKPDGNSGCWAGLCCVLRVL